MNNDLATEHIITRIKWKLEELGMTEQDLQCLAFDIAMEASIIYEEEEVHDAINLLCNKLI